MAVLLAVGLLGAGLTGAGAAESLYDVAQVAVDTTAKDAVAARNQGMAEAQMRAMKILMGRIVAPSVEAQLPQFTSEEVEQLVMGVAVRKEQTSTTRYVALLDVRFNPYSVRQFLASYGIPYSENRAPSISILPLMLEGDGISNEGLVGWRSAWEGLDLDHSITPATVLRPRSDLDAATVKAALAGDPDALATMRSNYGYGGLVIAAGSVDGDTFTARLVGDDAVGAVDSTQSQAVGGNAKAAAKQAAAASFALLESRWKTTQSGGVVPGTAAYGEGQPQATDDAPAEPAVVPRNVMALVEFSGLRDWQEIRTRLTQIAGLQALEVNSLSARGASVTFDFAGSLDALQAALGQNGFVLDDRDGTFVLRSQYQ